ncbi:A-kinase anchor protein SPHKAP isoform X2 [Sturnira hondurensis]|uniref:A-kinase anchor protein SPHKAP isoform X2 n=1 Tax=Sturnira hondurensis TaxID=192404 RepID=UPI001879B0D6|nr:A-kinase anchor protein SPHKAP isoform X2 [Sturnira hondurensis]
MATPCSPYRAMWVIEPDSPPCHSAALPARNHAQESSNAEPLLMCEAPAAQQGGASSSGSSLGSSVTACKKVLRSDSLLESTDYWLRNQRTPCQIGFVEDRSEHSACASVCFVNLDVNKDACSTEHLQQKLVSISPDLPKLISSMNVQKPKENEIVLLSGLTSGHLQADFKVSQCPWLPDICLVQCARGNRRNSTNCIIFEINKFLIGLELVQERQLHLEANVLKVEDDTNCSLSSIEEDFLTASEHLEEESEVEEYRNGCEGINVSANVMESKKPKEIMQEEWNYSKEESLYTLENKYISKYPMTLIKTEGSLGREAEDTTLQRLDPLAKLSERKDEAVGNEETATDYHYSENVKDQAKTLQALCIPDNACFPRETQDGPCARGSVMGHGHDSDAGDHEDGTNSLLPTQDGEATTGEYATNLAESVLQDAFIRLSQSQAPLPQESAVSVSVGSVLLPSRCSTKDIVVSRSWNDLPKIVIVQSPDGSNVAPEPCVSSCSEMEVSLETSGVPSGENASRHPQSALEVALACAATMIGTISSPQATERLNMEQEALIANHPLECSEPLQTEASQALKETSIREYSFPSALCGMTQVASAVAVCGLGEIGEVKYPEASSRILSAAESSAAIPPLFSLATGRGVELGKEAIAEALFKEAALVLTRPDTHSSIGDLMASMNRRIMEAASKPQSLCPENVLGNELAQALSNVILKHSIDEVHQQNQITDPDNGGQSPETVDTLMESTHQLLFNVIRVTFQKMSHIAQHGECPTVLSTETTGWREPKLGPWTPDQAASQAWTKATDHYSSHPLINPRSPSLVINDLVDDMPPQPASNGAAKPGLFQSPMLRPEWTCSARVPDSSSAKISPKETYLKGTTGTDAKHPHQARSHNVNERRASSEGERTPTVSKYNSSSQESEDSFSPHVQEKYSCASPLIEDVQVNLSLLGNDLPLHAQSMLHTKHTDVYCITDFAEELAETIVSMATEIAAICLDNSNGKQPWFCAWKRGSEFLVTPNVSCRSGKRKKESQAGGASGRKHKPPRLSEIKRKTDEHPELKEKLMNRVVDESMNLEDIPDSVNVFANEVAAKIVNLTEFSLVDGIWQAQSFPRNRLHSGDRWMRRKASSCESIAEEDSRASAYVSSLGLMSALSQPGSRASSVSKQSSCESITDEFSRFMVNQMETEGRGFELLLDYYAGKNASSIVSSAVQQACRRSDHLSVRPSCPSTQSSMESITEEFYRYMLRDAERENKGSTSSRRGSQDWTAGLLSPSLRSPLCHRQSSMPDSRALGPRLTVNAPLKANSLDGFAQNGQRDFLSVQPVSSASSTGLCKSDSCLYRRGGTDQITTMLIHETWANSIEALMRKNKIIADDGQASAEPVPGGSPLHRDKCANRLASGRVQTGPILLVQESIDYQRKDSVTKSLLPPGSSPSDDAHLSLDSEKETSLCHGGVLIHHPRQSLLSREVPLIQIETDQREECVGEPEHIPSEGSPPEEAGEHLEEDKTPDVGRAGDLEKSACRNRSDSLDARDGPEAEVPTEGRAPSEVPNPSSSSGESTESWCQLANEEDNPDDTSSFLQFSEQSMSELVEEKAILKGQSEKGEACVPGAPVGAASHQGSLLVINLDLEPECPDAELRATLQWIAASELGVPTIYFKKSQENRVEKFLDVVRLVHQKSWKVGDIFHAVVQYCKMHEEQKDGTPSLFDWLLDLG